MKKITFGIAIAAVIFLTSPTILRIFDGKDPGVPEPAAPTAYIERGTVVVKGPGNTLATVAAQIKNKEVFKYDAERKTAVCRGNISVEGELIIGDPKGEGLTETLEFNTRVCGDCMLLVRPGGSLKVYNAEISTVARSVIAGLCPQGYGILGQGQVMMHNVRLSYISGSSSTIFSGREARGVLDRVMSYGGDANAVSYDNINGDNVIITGSNFLALGNWGAWLGRTTDGPLVISRTVFSGKSGDMLVQGPADIVLEDCRFRANKISFAEQTSTVTIRWTRRFQLIDAHTAKPVAGARVTATSHSNAGLPKTCTATTDAQGFATLALVEYKATSRHPTRTDGVNNSAPYDITFETEGGRKATLTADPRRAATTDEYKVVKLGRSPSPLPDTP